MDKQINLNMLSEYIPYGEDNAVSRKDLVYAMQQCDRRIREGIAELRKDEVILHSLKGGYYKPLPGDIDKVKKHIDTEEKRLVSIACGLKYARKYYADMKRGLIHG